MITCHDQQLVEIVIGFSWNSPAVREGLQVREAILGIHAAGVGTGLPKVCTVRVGTHTMCI